MDNNQFKCPTCGGQFNSQEEMDKHAKEAHGQASEGQEEHSIMCSKCGMKTKSQQDLETHEKQHTAAS